MGHGVCRAFSGAGSEGGAGFVRWISSGSCALRRWEVMFDAWDTDQKNYTTTILNDCDLGR